MDPSFMKQRLLISLAVLLGLQGIAILLLAIPAPHAGGDNAAYLTLARALLAGEGYVEFWDPAAPPHAKYPPAYPLLLALWMAAGATTWGAFKALSGGLMVGAVALLFFWARERRGTGVAFTVALLVGLSTPWLEASRWILSEPLFLVGVFLALWAADRISEPERGRYGLVLATAGVLIAFFTRTAALPLFVAFLFLLAYHRRWRGLGAVIAVSAIPILFWVLRGRDGGEGAYQDEFWMVDPYDPSLGLVGAGGFIARILSNLRIYVGEVLGAAWWGGGMWALGLGVLLALLGLTGWGVRIVRRRVGLAEVFFPLYAGLILLWPEVWSGDRFFLPLYPLLLFWAVEVLQGGWTRLPRPHGVRFPPVPLLRRVPPGGVIASVLVALLLIPAAHRTWNTHTSTSLCRAVGSVDPWACYGPTHTAFRDAAVWAGIYLPQDAVVLNRKPRIFHLLGGVPGRVFPFDTRIEPLLETAEALGARYLLVDAVDGVSTFYLPRIVLGAPDHFCWMAQWGDETALLGILSAAERAEGRAQALARGEDPEQVQACQDGWTRIPSTTPAPLPDWGSQIPGVVNPPRR